MTKHQKAKQMYVDGHSVTHIATALGVSRTTIYNYKKEDLSKDIDWDELRYLKQTNATATKDDEKRFLSTLILNFENAMVELESVEEPKERLTILTKFVNAYYKIKAPVKGDCRGAEASGASEAIYVLSALAVEQNHLEVVNFLSDYHDVIIERVLSSIKG